MRARGCGLTGAPKCKWRHMMQRHTRQGFQARHACEEQVCEVVTSRITRDTPQAFVCAGLCWRAFVHTPTSMVCLGA
eukprot:COSAG01_NODE_1243_length_11083_cov_7.565368_8_plen_77_part_00